MSILDFLFNKLHPDLRSFVEIKYGRPPIINHDTCFEWLGTLPESVLNVVYDTLFESGEIASPKVNLEQMKVMISLHMLDKNTQEMILIKLMRYEQ